MVSPDGKVTEYRPLAFVSADRFPLPHIPLHPKRPACSGLGNKTRDGAFRLHLRLLILGTFMSRITWSPTSFFLTSLPAVGQHRIHIPVRAFTVTLLEGSIMPAL